MNDITLNPEQQRGHDMIIDFVKSRLPLFTIGGYAGTGKTTLIGNAVDTLREQNLRIAFCAFTGKASHVLKGKISLGPEDYCGTIHGMMYRLLGKVRNKLRKTQERGRKPESKREREKKVRDE